MAQLFVVALWFVLPILAARLAVRAGWRELAVAYGLWIAMLVAFGVASSPTWDEALGWPLILGLFFTIPAIPVLVLLVRLAGRVWSRPDRAR